MTVRPSAPPGRAPDRGSACVRLLVRGAATGPLFLPPAAFAACYLSGDAGGPAAAAWLAVAWLALSSAGARAR